MKKRVSKSIWRVQPYVPGKPIDEVKRELGLRQVIKLASNENPYGPSPKVLKAIRQAAVGLNRYPDANCFYLRKQLAQHVKVHPDQLVFGNGSDELIVLAIKAFVQEGDEVVIARPSFLIYAIASKLAGAKIKEIPLKGFAYDLDGMQKAITRRTKIVFIGNPDNPSGQYITQKKMKAFLSKVPSDVLVFIDEAYFEYVRASDYVDSLQLMKQNKNIIVTRTFSKMYGLAGLRIGYGMTTKEIADILNRIREPFNVNTLAQVAAMAVLKDKAYYRAIAQKMSVQRAYLYRQLDRLAVEYIQSFTNFILLRITKDAKAVTRQLLRKGVIVRDMSFWGLKNFIRVTIGTLNENKKLIQALEEIL